MPRAAVLYKEIWETLRKTVFGGFRSLTPRSLHQFEASADLSSSGPGAPEAERRDPYV